MGSDATRSGAIALPEVLLAAAGAAVLAAGFLGSALLEPGKVLGGLDHPLASLPWSARATPAPPGNPEISDPSFVFDPFLTFLRREVREGDGLPLWNPHQSCGAPAAGNPQFGHFSPLRALVHAMPVERSLAFQAAAKLWAALFFAYVLARRLRLSRAASALAALGFGLGGYQVLWLLYPLSDVSFLAPAVFLAIEAWFESRSRLCLAGLALAFGVALLGGHPETGFFLGACAGIHALARGLAQGGLGEGFRLAGGPILGLALGTVLASVSLLPVLEYVRDSSAKDLRAQVTPAPGVSSASFLIGLLVFLFLARRALARLRNSEGFPRALGSGAALGLLLAAFGVLAVGRPALERLLPALIPDFHGNPLTSAGYAGRTAYIQAASPYAGLATGLLALASFVFAPGAARIWKGTFLAAFVLVGSVPLLSDLVRLLPGFSIAEGSRAAPIANLSTALLAGFALDALLARGRALTRPIAGLGAAVVVAGLGLFLAPAPDTAGAAPAPARLSEGNRRLGFHEPTDGSSAAGTRLPFRGWATSLFEGDRIEVDLARADGVGARATAALDPPPTEGPGTEGAFRGFSGVFEPLFLAEGDYRIVGRILDAADAEVGRFDGGVVRLRSEGAVPARSWALAATFALLLALTAAGALPRALAGIAFVALAGADLWLFGAKWNPAGDASRVYPSTKVEEFLRQDPDLLGPQRQGRIWTDAGVFPPDAATRLGFLDVRGYDAIGLARFDLFLLALSKNPRLFVGRWTLRDLRTDLPAFDLLGVKVVLSPRLFQHPKFVPVWEGEVFVYRNRDFRGIALLSPGAQRASEVSKVEQVDPARAALVEEDVPIERPFATGQARVVSHSPDRVVVRASLDGEGILTLCENWFPGWVVEVGGNPARLLRTFTTFRGVKLGPGNHEVVFAYRPCSLRVGLGLSLAALAAILLLRFLPRRRG